ncbi:hypothetical protein BASA62_009377 [Batrachochytrium salamandrivorans]|nr:hypothetical protein BASA62_009377 [Batrachochytrium salamandrivorans]
MTFMLSFSPKWQISEAEKTMLKAELCELVNERGGRSSVPTEMGFIAFVSTTILTMLFLCQSIQATLASWGCSYSAHPFAHFVVECEQVAGHRIQSGLVPAIQKSRLRLLGRALDPGVENVYTWLRGGVLNGRSRSGPAVVGRGLWSNESMGTRHDNQALAARLADFLQVAYRTVSIHIVAQYHLGVALWKLAN